MDGLLQVIDLIYKLKDLKRTGWVRAGVPDPESVADHTFGVAILAALLPAPKIVDKNVAIRMALYHDLAEAITGDIVWESQGVQDLEQKLEKDRLEQDAINKINNLYQSDFPELATEYLEQKSPESKWIKQLDKLDMGLQAKFYGNLSEFITSAQNKLSNQKLQGILEAYRPD